MAVLGFRNLAGREDAQWLSMALSEMLTTELAAGERLRTIPGENVTRMKTELALADADAYASETLTRIRQNLGADLVVSGSYVTVGDGEESSLRVDIRLQDSREGRNRFGRQRDGARQRVARHRVASRKPAPRAAGRAGVG